MGKNYFRSWLTKKNNYLFWHQTFPSEKLDELITDDQIQKSIANSQTNQVLYAYIEKSIVRNYALLIDLKLREAFKMLTIAEFEEPSGFERKEKSSLTQKHYFETRQHLEYFLKHDIKQHDNPDAQLNAFRRWIDISSELLKRHCYEGFLLIFVNLQLIANPHLINGLPESSRTTYLNLVELSALDKNHSALRKFCQSNRDEHDLFPLIFWYHAVIILNESIGKLMRLKIKINKEMKDLKKHPDDNKLEDLMSERGELRKSLKTISTNIKDQLNQRENILAEIKTAQTIPVSVLPLNLVNTYHKIKLRHTKEEIEQARQQFQTIQHNNPLHSSQLYNQKLLPSFWSRRGKNPDKYWEEIFTPGYSKNN